MPELRSPRVEEAAAVAALMSTYAPEGVPEVRVRRDWSAPGFDLARDARVAFEGDEVAGFASVARDGDQQTWLELHGAGLEELLDWALDNASGRVFSGGWEGNESVRAALQRHQFELVRHSYRMAIDLDGGVAAPAWPEGMRLRAFEPGEERAVYEAHMETFEDSWEHVRQPYEEWVHWTVERPGFDPELWLLAAGGAEIAGIALCRVHDDDPETGWVSILGVRRPWRRRGLGRALLLASFAALASRGCRRAILGVDAASLTGANLLYESAGMRVVSRFHIYEKVL